MAKMAAATKTTLTIVVSLIVIVTAIVAWAKVDAIKGQIDSTQDDRIGVVEVKADTNKDTIGEMKVKNAEELATKKAIFDTLGRMEMVQQTMTKDVGAMKQDVAITKTKVEYLEKAE